MSSQASTPLAQTFLISYDMKAGPAKRLAEFIESLSQKLRNYSSLDDLKEILRINKVNGEDITSIKQFTLGE